MVMVNQSPSIIRLYFSLNCMTQSPVNYINHKFQDLSFMRTSLEQRHCATEQGGRVRRKEINDFK